nr:retrovirus-related Pol polyprotein from transposon TNT 1-94 [Tanacetum cinerariifolium]
MKAWMKKYMKDKSVFVSLVSVGATMTKEAWQTLEKVYKRAERVKQVRLQSLREVMEEKPTIMKGNNQPSFNKITMVEAVVHITRVGEVSPEIDIIWYLDSATSNHMCETSVFYGDEEVVDERVAFGDESKVRMKGRREKSEDFQVFKKFISMVEKATGYFIKALQFDRGEKTTVYFIKALWLDRGGEYMSTSFINFYDEEGARRFLTSPYSPQQNRVAERKNRTILNMIWSMLKSKNMPKEF